MYFVSFIYIYILHVSYVWYRRGELHRIAAYTYYIIIAFFQFLKTHLDVSMLEFLFTLISIMVIMSFVELQAKYRVHISLLCKQKSSVVFCLRVCYFGRGFNQSLLILFIKLHIYIVQCLCP